MNTNSPLQSRRGTSTATDEHAAVAEIRQLIRQDQPQWMLDKGVVLLQKPFTPSALAHKLREVLDQHGSRRLHAVTLDDDTRGFVRKHNQTNPNDYA